MKKALFLAAILSVQASADPRNPRPDWTEGSSMEYPRERYLIGVGSGDERAAAEDRARGEIARVFSSVVTVDTNVQATEAVDGKGASFSQSVSQNVATASRKALEGVEIVETWHDKASRQHWALAVLERSKAMASLQERLGDLDRQVRQWKERLEGGSDKLARVQHAMKLLTLLKAREELNAELRVVDPAGKGLPAPIDEAAVRPAAAKALSELDILIDISGQGAKQVATGVSKGLTELGLSARFGKAGGADIRIEGELESAPPTKHGAWNVARNTVTLSLKDARSDKTFLRFDVSESMSATLSHQEAQRRALDALAAKAAKRVREGIGDYFANQ